jgi:hypothetical protein
VKVFEIVDIDNAKTVVSGEKFSVTEEGHLVVSSGDTPHALFSHNTWKSVRERGEAS